MSRLRSGAVGPLTADQRQGLEFHVFFRHAFAADEEARRVWEAHGDQVMAHFQTRRPAQRPFGWWLFNHPELLRPQRDFAGRDTRSPGGRCDEYRKLYGLGELTAAEVDFARREIESVARTRPEAPLEAHV